MLLDAFRRYADSSKNRHVLYTAGGLVSLLAGRKLVALGFFAKGIVGLEKEWRAAHPDFDGDLKARWQRALDFYAETHKHDTNRKLHIVGIPFIVAGSAGLLLFPAYRPLWGVSAAAFVGGWVLNFIGHGVFEKNAPAFADDPLSFIAGPVWDFQQIFRKRAEAAPDAPEASAPSSGNGHAHATA
jgi:hypothetical protein